MPAPGSGNEITSTVSATCPSSEIIATGPVKVNASDASTIDAITGSVAIAINAGSGSGSKVGVALGAAVTINKVDASAIALVDDTTITATGQDVEITRVQLGLDRCDRLRCGADRLVLGERRRRRRQRQRGDHAQRHRPDHPRAPDGQRQRGRPGRDRRREGPGRQRDRQRQHHRERRLGGAHRVVVQWQQYLRRRHGQRVGLRQHRSSATTEALIDDVDATLTGVVDMDASSDKAISAIVVAASVECQRIERQRRVRWLERRRHAVLQRDRNSVLAVIRAADVEAAGDVTLDAVDSTAISATLVAVAASVGGQRQRRVRLADRDGERRRQRHHQHHPRGDRGRLDRRSTGGNLSLNASSDGSITATAIAASVGVGVGGGQSR